MGVVADVLLILWACKSKKSSFALCNEKLFFFFKASDIGILSFSSAFILFCFQIGRSPVLACEVYTLIS